MNANTLIDLKWRFVAQLSRMEYYRPHGVDFRTMQQACIGFLLVLDKLNLGPHDEV